MAHKVTVALTLACMTGFLLTENSHKIAVQLADRWATAVESEAARIRRPENLRSTVPDQWLERASVVTWALDKLRVWFPARANQGFA